MTTETTDGNQPVVTETQPVKPAEPATAPQPVPKAPTSTPQAPARQVATFAEKVKFINENGSVTAKSISAELATYVDIMAPRKPLQDTTVVQQQRNLFRQINIALDSGDEFSDLWNVLLMYFREYGKSGALSPAYLNRGLNHLKMEALSDRFARITDLLSQTADPATRPIRLKAIDLSKSTFGFSDGVVNKLTAFYGR